MSASAALAPARPRTRLAFMDSARGMAVAGMIVMHLVPAQGFHGNAGGLIAATVNGIEGKPAAAFCVLAGMAWEIQARGAGPAARFRQYVLRRAAALAGLGLALHILAWSTEVLIPLALMLVLTLAIRSRGPGAIRTAVFVLLALAPLASWLFTDYIASDWLENGGHLADTTFGWVTVRYLLVDGNYPLIPWLALPLAGMLMVRPNPAVDQSPARSALWCLGGITVMAAAWCITRWAESNGRLLGDSASFFASTWVPTTVPFLLISGGSAVAIIAGLGWLEQTRGTTAEGALACLGRLSLTHYIGHVLFIFLPLRKAYPAEDWPLSTGLAACSAYLVLAAPMSVAWLRGHSQGPLEGILSKLSGPRDRANYLHG